MVNVHKLCESGFPRVALTDSHNMFDGDRARQQPPTLCVEMGFYADISWESRCNVEVNV